MARETKFVQRSGGKIEPFDFLMVLVFRLATSLPVGLGLMTTMLNKAVSRSGLHQRFNGRTVIFIRRCLQLIMLNRLLEARIIKVKLFDSFAAVLIIDSSSWDIPELLKDIFPGSGGAASKANCKIQFCYDYRTGSVTLIEEMAGTVPDQKYSKQIGFLVRKGTLVLFDLGYWSFESFYDINSKGGCFVSRLNNQVNIWAMKNGKPVKLQLNEILRKERSASLEMEVCLRGTGGKLLKIRLIAFRAPEEVANIRKMNLRKNAGKEGRTPREKSLELCGWSIFVTNADKDEIPGEMIRSCYRIRWCVELIFKSWKSILKIHRTNVSKNKHRLKCELYAKLITAVIVHTVHQNIHAALWNEERKELSFDKLWKWVNLNWGELHKSIVKSVKTFSRFINSRMTEITGSCEKYHQPSRKTSLQIIDEMIGDPVPIKFDMIKYLRGNGL